MLDRITNAGFLLIRIVSGILAVIFAIYALFTLWDMYRTEIKAFASYDLLKYRPNIEEEEPPYLDDLLEINPDTAGWVTIYGTNIDYPVMKGRNDNEYLNKSATGEYTVSGSVFMSQLNSKDFSDPYTLLYAHHMENGSMFGDIDKFRNDEDFFYNKANKRFKKDEGVLIMQEMVWNLKVFAVMETSAYNELLYRADKAQTEIPGLIEYAKNEAVYFREVGDIDKVLALSTCASSATYGRYVLLCSMEKRTDPLPTREEEPLTPHRKAMGHPMAGAYWALMNLACLLTTIICALRAIITKERISLLRKKNRRILKISVLELMLAITSLLIFILTEDMHKPIRMTDAWTLPMIAIFALLFITERIKEKEYE